MTLNIKLPDDLIKTVAKAMCKARGIDPDGPTMDIHIPSDPDAIYPWSGFRGTASVVIIAALEKMVEIGMARHAGGCIYNNGREWEASSTRLVQSEFPDTLPTLIIRLDAGEKHE